MILPINSLFKLAHAIEMSFDVPDAEKDIAVLIIDRVKAVSSSLKIAEKHLDIMYDPFKKHENISSDAIHEKRGVLARYKKQAKENFNKVNQCAIMVMDKLNFFASDTQILEITNAFKDSIEDLQKKVEIFLDTLDQTKSDNFRKDVLSQIDEIKSSIKQTEDLVKDRIISHLTDNVMASDWVTNTSQEMNLQLEKKMPMVSKLFRERQQILEQGTMPQALSRPQALNPMLEQQIMYPNDQRPPETKE